MPLLLLPSVFAIIRVFSSESALHSRWPKNWSFSFSNSLSNEYSGLISFRISWLELLTVQGILKSLLQHHSSKASILRCLAIFMVHLSHPCTTTGKTITLTMQTFVGKVMSQLFNTLSKIVIAFLLGASNFMAVITVHSDFGAQENKICHFFHFSPCYLPWSDRTRCHGLSFLNVEFQASFFTLLFHSYQETVY